MADSLKAIPIESLPSASELEMDDQLIAYRAGDNQAYKAKVSNLAAETNANISDSFSTLASYAVGDYCIYDNKLYRCTTAHSGAWSDADFEEVTVAEMLSEINTNEDISDKIEFLIDTSTRSQFYAYKKGGWIFITMSINPGSGSNTIATIAEGYRPQFRQAPGFYSCQSATADREKYNACWVSGEDGGINIWLNSDLTNPEKFTFIYPVI